MVDSTIYGWAISILVGILFGYCILSHQRYQTLQTEYDELLLNKNSEIEILIKQNEEKELIIEDLEYELIRLDSSLDSLKKRKTQIHEEKDNFVISPSISESVLLLKKNLYEMNN